MTVDARLAQDGACCEDCGDPFRQGDHYAHRDEATGLIVHGAPGAGSWSAVVCLGCAALQAAA